MFGLDDLGSILSGGGGLVDSISGLFGGGGDEKALKLAQKQFKLMKKLALAGQEDPFGNGYYWDESTNTWRTKLSPLGRATQLASDNEELDRLMNDLPQQREEMRRASLGRGEDSQIADTLRSEIENTREISPDELEGLLYGSKARGIRESIDTLGNQFATQGLRTGINPGRSLEQLSQTLSRELGNASSDAKLEALTGADSINQSRRAGAIDAYGAMSDRANNVGGVPFNPATLSAGLNSIAANKSTAYGPLAYSGASTVRAASVPQSTYGRIGTAASGLFDALGGVLNKKPTTDVTTGNTTYTS